MKDPTILSSQEIAEQRIDAQQQAKADRFQGQCEISHIHQFESLNFRAKNFGLHITFGSWGFTLSITRDPFTRRSVSFDKVGDYQTLAELRAGISDWVAARRMEGASL